MLQPVYHGQKVETSLESMSRSPSTYSKSTVGSKRHVDYYKMALNVLNGSQSTQDIDKEELRQILVNLAVLRCEANASKDQQRVMKISDLIKKLNEQIKPPPMQRSPAREVRDGCSMASRSTTNSPMQTPQKQQQQRTAADPSPRNNTQDMELEKFLEILDKILDGEEPELEGDDDQKKLMHAVKYRTKEAIEAGDYDLVRHLDEISDGLNAVWEMEKDSPAKSKMKTLARRLDYLEKRKAQLEDEKNAELLRLTELQSVQLEEMHMRFEEEVDELQSRFPTEDDRMFQRSSATLLEMRNDEVRMVKAREYEHAKAIQRRADALEKLEKETKRSEMTKTCERMRDKLLADQKKAQQGFDIKWDGKMGAVRSQYDAQIKSIQTMIDHVLEDMERTRKDLLHHEDDFP